MTTIAEFKKMLQEEIDEPLDYPRVPGLSAKELGEYNEGYQSACHIVLMEAGATDDDWRDINIECLTKWIPDYRSSGYSWSRGRRDAYTWALKGLKGLEGESQILAGIKTCFDAPDNVMIPRARYNHLLEVERNAQEFVESFTRWEA